MDRRQIKTRNAIFHAFTQLLNTKDYSAITVQDIIDAANISRSTFYAHFDTKDALLRDLCRELFDHITETAMDRSDTHGLYTCSNASHSMICHVLQHLSENDHNILFLLSCQSSSIFLRHFKNSMGELIRTQYLNRPSDSDQNLPADFLINHISGSFVEMVQWWLDTGKRQTPEELDQYFRAVIEPILQ